jgi:type IV fimbrial biogenesis protein FimT
MHCPFPRPCSRRPFRPQSFAARQQGMTLVELAITLTVCGILVSAGVPAYMNVVLDNRQIAHLNHLVGDLALARSEAVKRGASVTVCKSSTGTGCTSRAAWNDGWIVFTDPDLDRKLDPDETILRRYQPTPDGVFINFSAFGSRNNLSYRPTGFTYDRNGTFTFCDSRGSGSARALILYKTGRVRVSRTKSSGDPLTCI